MRCKKHLQDVTSTVGVCASCLCERLQPLLAAQAQAQAQSDDDYYNYNNNNNNRYRKPKSKPKQEPESEPEQNPPPPPPINFPSSVSPYVTHRKSDRDRRRERMFYGTPQVTTAAACDGGTKRRSGGRFWNLSNIFRARSNKTEFTSRGEEPSSSASPPPPSWFSNILHTRRHGCRNACRQRANRGLSPSTAAEENCCDSSDEAHDRTDSGNSAEASPAGQNPTATAAQRRSRLGVGGGGGKGLSSMAFCLSPLVRASPNRHWSHKGLAQELGAGGTHHMSSAASFCANRSRKMADFGRVAHNR